MNERQQQLDALLREAEKLHLRNTLAETLQPNHYEPGNMEYLEQSDGLWDPESGRLTLLFESRGTRYDGRSEMIERLHVGDPITLQRDPANPYNPNNLVLHTKRGEDVGNLPAELCNVVAPLYDAGALRFDRAAVSFVEPLSKRSRHARQAVLFVELVCTITA
jgi:hypothetical protein